MDDRLLDLGNDLRKGTFIARPNRFTAEVEVEGSVLLSYLCYPGRMPDLAVRGTPLLVKKVQRRQPCVTHFDLLAMRHRDTWVTVDCRLPNMIFRRALELGLIADFGRPEVMRAEFRLDHSRFDFYLEAAGRPCLVEVKGCTLVHGGIALFPDAPTLRGARHLEELAELQGAYSCFLVMILQRPDVSVFTTHDAMDPAFGRAVRKARGRGVGILACKTSFDGRYIHWEGPVPVDLALAAEIAPGRTRQAMA